MVYSAGGEAEPVFPTFDSVLLVTGQIVKPRRVLPVTGFHGQELWSSDVGLQVSSADPETLEPGHQLGPPQEAHFNSMRKDREQLEGGALHGGDGGAGRGGAELAHSKGA